jgi:hypothetical protein
MESEGVSKVAGMLAKLYPSHPDMEEINLRVISSIFFMFLSDNFSRLVQIF